MHIPSIKSLVALLAASMSFAASANEPQKPVLGACIVSVSGMTPACIPALTQDACNERAGRNGGTPTWQAKQNCPDHPEAYIDKTGAPAVIYERPQRPVRPVQLPAR